MTTSNDMPREFLWCGTTFADPDPGLSAIEVRDMYAVQFSELTNAAIKPAVITNGVKVIEFTKNLKNKG